MSGRTLLGPADVSAAALRSMVAASVGPAGAPQDVEVLTCSVEVAEYDIEALTTAGRYWVRGRARHPGGDSAYAFFVKVVQSWTRTPQFQLIPDEMRDLAANSLPWRIEPLVYRSDLGERLPDGLSLPEVYAVIDIDDTSAGLWLEAVDADPAPWRTGTFARAAYLLGRLAASSAVNPVNKLGTPDVVRNYAHGRVQGQILPALHNDELWAHPSVAEAFDPVLRNRILAAADALPGLVDELSAAPSGSAHGDACPRNLLVARGAPDRFVAIDWAFWCQAPLGFDLGQLLLGEVQLGERPASELAVLEDLCLSAYVRGLHAEGCDVSLEAIRRAHALQMWLFTGLSAVPIELAYGMPSPGSAQVISERAQAAAFILDLVDATSGG